MPEQQLDGAQIGAGLQQMHGEGMAQGMWPDRLADLALQPHLPAGAVDCECGDRPAGPVTREQPLSGMGTLPIIVKSRAKEASFSRRAPQEGRAS